MRFNESNRDAAIIPTSAPKERDRRDSKSDKDMTNVDTKMTLAEEDDFNQGLILPPLLVQLKKILEQYPDDNQILKELIQNAEDAGARGIQFLFDHKHHGTNPKTLHHPGLAKYQGAALYAHNDAVFDEDDWRGIRMLSQSVKQHDRFKVGYFGMGFKSIFHITDMPSVLSGDKLGVIEPHSQVFPHSTHSWNINKHRNLQRTLPDQFAPFINVFDTTRDTFSNGYYNGTLFRFPLRAQASQLSEVIYDADRVNRLYEVFEDEAHLVLLFLRHLESVELYERDENSFRPKLLFKVHIHPNCLENVRRQRTEFLAKVKRGSAQWMDHPVVATYPITIETIKKDNKADVKKQWSWLITNYYSGGHVSAVFRKLYQDSELSYPPWVGVAMTMKPAHRQDGTEEEKEEGHVFCFLPLPQDKQIPTGLPVHVNGFFALEQNRKYIKWPSLNQRRVDLMDKRLLWNQCLLQEAIPHAYYHLLLNVIESHRSGNPYCVNPEVIYRAFPDFNRVDRRWEPILVPLYAALFKQAVVFTTAGGGDWILPKDAIFNTLDDDEVTRQTVLLILSRSNVKVAHLPQHVLRAITTCCHMNMGKITPQIVAFAYREIQHSLSISREGKLSLLRYVATQLKYDLLDGLELLPLANGGFEVFHTNPKRADRPIYVATSDHPLSILPHMADDLLDPDCDPTTKQYLAKGATKGYTQLLLLSKDLVAELLQKFLPADWLRRGGRVTWVPGEYGQPPEGWLENLWHYLQRNFRRDLSVFEKLPIIPVPCTDPPESANKDLVTDLIPLYCPTGIIVKTMDGLALEDEIELILRKLGVVILDDLPLYIRNHQSVGELYVHAPSYIGVLKVMFRICQHDGIEKFIKNFMEQTNDSQKRLLRSYFARMSPFDLQFRPEFRQVLNRLPLFETLPGSGSKDSHWVSAHDLNVAAPTEKLPVTTSKRLIHLNTPDAENLASLMRIRKLTVIELLREIIFPDVEDAFYAPDDLEDLMLYVLKHYHAFLEMDTSFTHMLRSLPFMPRKDMLYTPDRFYYPEQELLQKLFLGESYFPSGKFANTAIIAILKDLGLRDLNDVEAEDLIETAHQIQDSVGPTSTIPIEDAEIKSEALMEYIRRFPQVLETVVDGEPLYKHLLTIRWVRPISERPPFYPDTLDWYKPIRTFEKACDVKDLQYSSLVGSSAPIVDAGEIGDLFGWTAPPSLDAIAGQLTHIAKFYNPAQKANFMNLTERVYKELCKFPPKDVVKAFKRQKCSNWVWHGEGFTRPEHVVFKRPFMDLRPFVHSIPREMEEYSEFFKSCGVRHDVYLPDVLTTIKDNYEQLHISESEAQINRDLHIATSILNELKTHIHQFNLAELQAELVLPVHCEDRISLRMAPLKECTYCDQEWLRQGYNIKDLTEDDDENILLVHPNVPYVTSEALGVPTLMSRMLDAEELDFSFGQSDSLTHRLSVLLREYTDGFAVPKELIQNADDAGATEVRFLYDERENEDVKTCLIDEGMKECQGPALWAYNDAVFKDEDFENITKLSGATKESKLEMIGRFGLGFNAVYNLTDVPIFISRHNIVIFDPHTTYLGNSIKNKSKPGIKIDTRKHRRKLQRLGNQFKPFNNIFGCDLRTDSLQEAYNGTLFRFPLRTKSQAIKSEICQKHYDSKEVKSLLSMLARGAESLLLFTQNVVKISIFHIPPHARCIGTPVEIFKVSKEPVQFIRELYSPVPISKCAEKLPHPMQTFIKQNNILKAAREVLVRMKCGKKVKPEEIPRASSIVKISINSTRLAEKIISTTTDVSSRPWLIVNAFGTGPALKMAINEDYLSPIGGVAVPLWYNRDEGENKNGDAKDETNESSPDKTTSSSSSTTDVAQNAKNAEKLRTQKSRSKSPFSPPKQNAHPLTKVPSDIEQDMLSLDQEKAAMLFGKEKAAMLFGPGSPTSDKAKVLPPSPDAPVSGWKESSHKQRSDKAKYSVLSSDEEEVVEDLSDLSVYLPEPIVDGEHSIKHHGTIFSFMPLPIHSGLPVHINGGFAVASNRRHLCDTNEDDKFDLRVAWNEALLEDSVCKAYLMMLEDLANLTRPSSFTALWPRANVETNVVSLQKSLYRTLVDATHLCPPVYSDGLAWVQFVDTLFLDAKLRASPIGKVIVRVFRECLNTQRHKLIDLPDGILQAFRATEHERPIVEHSYNLAKFLRSIFLPNILSVDAQYRDPIILYALEYGTDEVMHLLKNHPCIPVTPHGEALRLPSEVIDLSSDIAGMYGPDDGRFPYGKFASKGVILQLQTLGMSKDDITWDDVIERIESLDSYDYGVARRRIICLLNYLQKKLGIEESKEMLDGEKPDGSNGLAYYKERIMQMKFLPLLPKPKHFILPWKGEAFRQQDLMEPENIYPQHLQSLLCCVATIADESVFPKDCDRVKRFLGLDKTDAGLELVLEQLNFLMHLEIERPTRDVLEDLRKIMHAVFDYLQFKCNQNRKIRLAIISELHDKPCIYAHGHFLRPVQCALDFPHHCTPYLYGLPDSEKAAFQELYLLLGVRETFSTANFVEALRLMHSRHGERQLGRNDVQLALRIVNLLNESLTELDQTLDDVIVELGTIYIPDSDGVLRSSTELCYNEPNCQWVPGDNDTKLSHPLIPFAISKQLGVNTRRQEVLSKHSMGIPFGQREKLTNRIRRILSSYPCDKEIMKELLQNADDAGASEIHFVKDVRSHPAERVFDDSWKPLQGPALCVYNNRPFTENDLEGIQRLGEGSKNTDPNKTGQYGVGFNCVYHLTDAPSFLTCGPEIGETLCIFDPHAKYVPGASIEEPGRRYNDVPELRTIFKDVFPCYLEDKFPLGNGTMFRFPLRTPDMAAESELSDQPITPEILDGLIGKFKQDMFDCLLFVNNVRSISVSDIDKLTKRLCNTYTVFTEISDDDILKRTEFANYLKMVSKNVQNGNLNIWDIKMREVAYEVKISDSKGYWERWLVVQRIGFEENSKLPHSVYDAFRKGELALMPRGGIAALLGASSTEAHCRPKKAYCFLPLPVKTGLPVHVNGHFALDHEARRNIWIDDDNSSKTDWNITLLDQVIARSYITLLKLAPSFLDVPPESDPDASFISFHNEGLPDIEAYSKLFPTFNSKHCWKGLSRSVYRHIHDGQVQLLPYLKTLHHTMLNLSDSSTSITPDVEIQWTSTLGESQSKPYFDNLDDTFVEESDGVPGFMVPKNRQKSTPKKKSKRDVIRRVLLNTGFRLLCLPMTVFNAFTEAGVNVQCISPASVVRFFRTYSLSHSPCKVGTLPACIGNTQFGTISALQMVMSYCIKERDFFLKHLEGLPFLLTEDDQLRVFCADEYPFLSIFPQLLPDCGCMFTHHALVEGVFNEVKPEDYQVFQRLDIGALATLLANALPPERYMRSTIHIRWDRDGQNPTAHWIKILWSFLRCECNRLAELNGVTDDNLLESAKLFMKPLHEWSLIPAHVPGPTPKPTRARSRSTTMSDSQELESKENFLVSLSLAETVVDFTHVSIMNIAVRDSLRKLGVPELSVKLLDGTGQVTPLSKSLFFSSADITSSGILMCNSDLARQLVANMENPKSILCMLEHFINSRAELTIRREDCNVILKYFNDSVDQWVKDEKAVETLRSLPLFLSIRGDLVDLGNRETYVLPTDTPATEMSAWEKDRNRLFLHKNKSLNVLHGALGCKSLSSVDVYTEFIFPYFSSMSQEAQIVHLQFLKNTKLQQCTTEESEKIIEALRELEFLADSNGILRTASYFYDPYHAVFKAMHAGNPSAFPPAPFSEFKWLNFLRKIGLQQEVSPPMFVDYADLISQEAQQRITQATFDKSRTLISHLFKRQNLATDELLYSLIHIPFIPPVKVSGMLQKMFPQYGSDDENPSGYVAFCDTIPETHEYLVWSSAYLLPDWANPYKLAANDVSISYEAGDALADLATYRCAIGNILCIPEEPPLDAVVDHVRNICADFNSTTMADDMKAFMKVDVMRVVYKYLQNKLVGNEEVCDQLRDVPCLLVDTGCMMVKPSQTVINLFDEDQIVPYLYKAPTELGEFKRLFTFLGASLGVTIDQYAGVLENIQHRIKGAKMHPNEMKAAFKAVKGLFSTLEKHPKQEIHTERLYLPSRQGTLLPVYELVFNDDPTLMDRIHVFDRPFLVDLEECDVSATNQEDLIRKLPKRLQPIMLTSVVREMLDDRSRHTMTSHGVSERLRHQLSSKAFAAGLTRLIKHEYYRHGQKVPRTVLDNIRQQLRKIRVYGVERVITFLTYQADLIAGSELESECFVDHTDDDLTHEQVWNIFVDSSAMFTEELIVSVADVVNRIIGSKLRTSVQYLQPMISCPPHTINKVLDRLKVRPDHSVDFKEPTLPNPGNFIPMEDHHLLREDIEDFEIGEYVGYELEDDEAKGATYIYAVIIEKGSPSSSSPAAPPQSPHHVAFSNRYKISIGEDRQAITALVTDLYKFHRVEGFVSQNTSMHEDEFGSTGSFTSSRFDSYEGLHTATDGVPRRRKKRTGSRPSSMHEEQYTAGGGGAQEDNRDRRHTFDFSNAQFKDRVPTPEEPQAQAGGGFSRNSFSTSSGRFKRDKTKKFWWQEDNESNKEAPAPEMGRGAGQHGAHGHTGPEPQQHQSRFNRPGAPGASTYTHREEPRFEQGFPEEQEYQQEFYDANQHFDQGPEQPQEEQVQDECDGPTEEETNVMEEDLVNGPDEETIKVLEEVSDALEDAWRLEEPQRKKVIKRLLLKWHPDKNIGNERFSTVITQHIYSEIDRLEQGLPRPSTFAKNFAFDPRNPFAGSTNFQRNFEDAYKFFFEQMNQRAKDHKEQRERYQENFSREYKEYNHERSSFQFDVPPTFSSANPQPAQATRFFQQAQEDLRAADNDYETEKPAYEWVCFKAHQAAEKALKAAQYSVDAVSSFSHDLAAIAATIEDAELRSLAMKLQNIIGDASKKFYNPDPIDFLVIPHDEFTKEKACDATICAFDILEKVKVFMEIDLPAQ